MTLMSKPCGRPRCQTSVVMARRPSDFARRKYCSVRCAVRHRIDSGWQPTRLTTEARVKAGQKMGRARAIVRRREMLARAWVQVKAIIPTSYEAKLSQHEIAGVRLAVTKAFLMGKEQGYETGYWKRRGEERKQA